MALYQYVGSGDEPPKQTNFMGKYQFTLNHEYVDVTDPQVLAKIKNHPCFKLKVEQAKKAPKKVAKKKAATKKVKPSGNDNGST